MSQRTHVKLIDLVRSFLMRSNEYFLSNLQTSASIQPRTSILKLRTPFNFHRPVATSRSSPRDAQVSLEAGLHRPALLYVLRRVLVRSSQVLHGRFLSWLHFPSAGAPAMRAPSSGTELDALCKVMMEFGRSSGLTRPKSSHVESIETIACWLD